MNANKNKIQEVTLHSTHVASHRFAHPWIYKSQIKNLPKETKPGDNVVVKSPKGSVIGMGYYNPSSEIAIRILSRESRRIDREFFAERIHRAAEYRKQYVLKTNAVRWVNSESDQLPGLIVDQYNDTLVVQFLTMGMDVRRQMVLDALQAVMEHERVYERSDGAYRHLEGMVPRKGWLKGDGPAKIEIREGDVRYWVDVENGHKTGFYLDQRESRAAVGADWKGLEVLDCFAYTGGFAVAAAKRGAASVTGLDISETAVELARENARLNGVSACEFHRENAFDYLRRCEEDGRTFDAVILDPPSFTRTKGAVEKAKKGYKEIHLRALKILKPQGKLWTFCCSHHVGMDDFQAIILDAARDARRALKVTHYFHQAKDHPVILSIPETLYLKGLGLSTID